MFKLDVLDEIIMSRLQKNKDENKLVYLLQAHRRIDSHLYVTQKLIDSANAQEVKDMIISFFMTLLQAPETFNLTNKDIQ